MRANGKTANTDGCETEELDDEALIKSANWLHRRFILMIEYAERQLGMNIRGNQDPTTWTLESFTGLAMSFTIVTLVIVFKWPLVNSRHLQLVTPLLRRSRDDATGTGEP